MDKGGRLASFSGVVLYDTLRIDAGVLPTRDFVFFQNPVGATQGLFVAGTQYSKQDIDIHQWISNGGQLSQGYEALLWEIGVQFHVVGSLDNSVQTAGNAINLALDPGTLSSGATAPAFAIEDGYLNNGFGWAYQMPVMRHLPPLTKFGVRMSVQNPFTTLLTGPVRVVVTLGGLGVQPVTG